MVPPSRLREAASPGPDVVENPSFGTRRSSSGSERGRTVSIERLEAAVKNDEDGSEDAGASPSLETVVAEGAPKVSKGKENLELVTGIGAEPLASAPNVVEILAGPPPLVRVETGARDQARSFGSADRPPTAVGIPNAGGEFHEQNPFLYQPTPIPHRPTSPPTVSVVRRRKERSRDVGHSRKLSGKMITDPLRPLASPSHDGREGATSPRPGRRLSGDMPKSPGEPAGPTPGGAPPANPQPVPLARPAQPQIPAGAAQIPGPREAFLAIDVRTVRTHVYHLVAHTLLLPFVVALLGEYVVFPITSIIFSYVVLVSPGHYLFIDFLHWLGRELLRSRASRSVMAGFCYGVGRELSVRWWRGRMKQERNDFTVEDWTPAEGEAATSASAAPTRASTAPTSPLGTATTSRTGSDVGAGSSAGAAPAVGVGEEPPHKPAAAKA
jgi:hypothetical protein